jgi:phospholipid-binding lipoprotein MlaA
MRGSLMLGVRSLVVGLLILHVAPLRAAETESRPLALDGPNAWFDEPSIGSSEPDALLSVRQDTASATVVVEPRGKRGVHAPDAAAAARPEPDPLFDDDFALDLSGSGVADPLERVNRRIFVFNQTLDMLAWDPMTRGYQFVVPEPARHGVHRFFQNLESPVIFANQLLQLRFGAAATTLGRFVLNSTAGAGGLFDPAARGAGWQRADADFGQTLARYGTPSGAYLMVPLLGPSNVRDLFGDVVDRLLDPLTYLVGPIQWWIVLGTSQGLAERDAHSEELHALEASSIDYYSALRSAYHQSRQAQIRRVRGERDVASGSYSVGSF